MSTLFLRPGKGQDRKQTRHHGAAGWDTLHFERPPDNSGSVVHQMQPHSFIARNNATNAEAVILDCKRPLMLDSSQANDDLAGVTVLDRVVNRLPRNIVEMRGHRIVMNQDGSKTLEPAADREQVFHFARP